MLVSVTRSTEKHNTNKRYNVSLLPNSNGVGQRY